MADMFFSFTPNSLSGKSEHICRVETVEVFVCVVWCGSVRVDLRWEVCGKGVGEVGGVWEGCG